MSSGSSFSLPVDITNPGQFFACCGLLELAHRLWHDTEGWFVTEGGTIFNIRTLASEPCTLSRITDELVKAGITGELSVEEQAELQRLESQKRTLSKLSEKDEERRSSLGKKKREGALIFGPPFNSLRLSWWQEENSNVPKTFAGKQEVYQMAQAMLSELDNAVRQPQPLEYRSLLQREKSKVEPFYFDAKRFTHALDVGFSLDVQEKAIRASAAPLTEILALIGLQRFRPRQMPEDKWAFEYFAWDQPLGIAVAAAVACGAIPIAGQRGYRFWLKFRDDQKRYKAFSYAIGDAI
ncbi:MAG: type I-U CRISPR-associated protein Cas8c [Chloroflexi bacterium]|nr:type I-U CRISPR-associated protein Cas8c [Chloroflexota bacterium]